MNKPVTYFNNLELFVIYFNFDLNKKGNRIEFWERKKAKTKQEAWEKEISKFAATLPYLNLAFRKNSEIFSSGFCDIFKNCSNCPIKEYEGLKFCQSTPILVRQKEIIKKITNKHADKHAEEIMSHHLMFLLSLYEYEKTLKIKGKKQKTAFKTKNK